MNQPTPAIVAQSAVRRLPRLALVLLCIAYVLPGFIGREPWKNADVAGLGYIQALAEGRAAWLAPQLLGQPPEFDALLPYWLGAWAMQAAPAWLAPDFAARLPFIALLVLTLAATWYAAYYLARSPGAQPVAFAFGGEAHPTDYARALADAALLALIACLGLMQLSHETTPSLAQLAFTATAFYGLAALPYRPLPGTLALAAGLLGLALSSAPSMAVLFALGGAALHLADPGPDGSEAARRKGRAALLIVLLAVAAAAVAAAFHTWHWRLPPTEGPGREWRSIVRLIAWFTWPAWPLALWTVWRWRHQLRQRHVALPLWFAAVSFAAAVLAPNSARALLLGLPALATLAAFALPTFRRSVSALIDWFALLFFSGCALFIWVMWVAMQTGVPAKPAANVAKLAPGFEPQFGAVAFVTALAATLGWLWLVRWRTSRNRDALWKSLVLPAGGATLAWLLMMTLWLPVLNYARSYKPVVDGLVRAIDAPGCVETVGLTRAQLAALRFHGGLDLHAAGRPATCPWLVAAEDAQAALPVAFARGLWQPVATVQRPTDAEDNLVLYRRRAP